MLVFFLTLFMHTAVVLHTATCKTAFASIDHNTALFNPVDQASFA